MNKIEGIYYFPASSKSANTNLLIHEEVVTVSDDSRVIYTANSSSLSIASAIPGVKLEVKFSDGGLFIAANINDRLSMGNTSAEKLEKSKIFILAAIILVPIFFWFLITVLMPAVAKNSVKYLPYSVSEQLGEQTFSILQKTVLEPSELNEHTKIKIKSAWQKTILALGLSAKKYQLYFFNSEYFGPNAFALPNGTVVITDDLVVLLNEDIDVIEAILLHEIGHVEHQHGLKLAAQSAVNTIVLSVVFGDIEGVGEIIVGTGAALIQNAFSREMEREADNFALTRLVALNKSPQLFAKAMQSFLLLKNSSEADLNTNMKESSNSLLRYLSTHPDTQERINTAKKFGNQ